MQVAKKIIIEQLSPIYAKEEIEGLTRLIFEKVLGLSLIGIHLNQNETISAANLAQIKEIINRLVQFEPIQYIFGETEFYGSHFKVNRAVLIPRQETEELVDWIIKDYTLLTPTILDIGTGSGCIPITLVKNLPGASANGWDISPEALFVAKENAKLNNAEVAFECVDILKSRFPEKIGKFDIIVSNPPYVTASEQVVMHPNVTKYEPHIALFVPDSDPLIFYRKIADLALELLKPGGHLYLEINEKYGTETAAILASKGLINITLKQDINGKERMIRAGRNFES